MTADLNAFGRELDEIRLQLTHFVDHKQMLRWAAAAALVIISGAWTVTRLAVADARETMSARVESLEHEVRSGRAATDNGVTELRADVKALYTFLLTRKPQARLEEEEANAPVKK